jgi:hypothetical protein
MEEWHMPTIAKKWQVKDIASHLLDGNLRGLSIYRDKYFGEKPEGIEIYPDLVAYLNKLNAEWVTATKRLSPNVLISLLEVTGKQYTEVIQNIDPWEDAVFSVAWAGDEISKNWFHIAREYTEKWIHQQQIRDAVNKPGIITFELFHPFIDTFMCALPHAYKYTEAATGTSVEVVITTEVGGAWHINKTDEGWVLRKATRLEPDAQIVITPDVAWKLFSKGITPQQALDTITINGDKKLGMVALGMVSVMA